MNKRFINLSYLCLLLLLCAVMTVTACGGHTDTPSDTDTYASASDTQTVPATGAPTEANTLPPAPTELTISPEDYVVVLSDYAAEWEKTAASELSAALGIETVSDKNVPDGKKKLLVGWTQYNDDMQADFTAAGELGYLFSEKDGNILLGANTESGMKDACAAFKAAVKDHVLTLADCVSAPKNPEAGKQYELTGPWADSVSYAHEAANSVSMAYLDGGRGKWTISNQNVVLYYDCHSAHCYTAVTTKAGIPYLQNTLNVYVQDGDGKMHWSTEQSGGGHYNAMQLGYYYYNAHVFDEGFGKNMKKYDKMGILLDRGMNMYADKLNMVQHIVPSQKSITNILSYGMVMEIPAERVLKLVIKDAAGVHEGLEGVDFDTVEYVGFDIERAGILGYILALDDGSGTLTVTLENGVYTVDQHIDYDPEAVLQPGQGLYFGQRLYTDTAHTFDAFLKEAEFERHPLEGITITEVSDGAKFAGYNGLRGAYEFKLNGTDFSTAYYKNPDKHYAVHASITCDDEDRRIWVFTNTSSGGLECAALLDGDNNLVPIPVEVGKNFAGEMEEAYYFPGDPGFGMVFFPLTLKSNQTLPFTVLNLYQNWGIFPLKQLSSISFVSPYYHLSTGVTETNCIAPTYVFGKDFWLLPDFRSMSAPLWSDQPQHTSIGRLYVANTSGVSFENVTDTIDSSGPVYADVTLRYADLGGKLDLVYRHVEMPQTDENRTYYTMDLTVNKEFTVADFTKDFDLFGFDSRDVLFGKFGYLNENNEPVVEELNLEHIYNNRIVKLGTEYPYYDYFGVTNSGNTVNFSLIIRDWDIVLGGRKYEGGFIVRDYYKTGTAAGINAGYLTLDIGEITLKPGDHIHIDYILLPWGHQSSRTDENVLNVRADSCIDPLTVKAETGEVIPDAYVPKVRMNDGTAIFTVTGGCNNSVARVYGMESSARPKLLEKIDGAWVEYETNKTEYDGGMIYYDGDGTYSFAFVFDMTGQGVEGRTFKVVSK